MREFTINQIAKALSITKPTVRKYLKQLKIEPIRKEVNRLLYSEEAANRIAAEIGSTYVFNSEKSENSKNAAEKSEIKIEKTENEIEKSENAAENSEKTENEIAFNSVLAMLKEEIEKKDKEIAELKTQIQKKDARIDKYIDEIIAMSGKAQYITAADKTTTMIEKKQQLDNSKTVNKKWFQFWL